MGLIVSTFRTVVTPRRSLSGSQTNCGEWRKTGWMTAPASRIRSTVIEASTPARIGVVVMGGGYGSVGHTPIVPDVPARDADKHRERRRSCGLHSSLYRVIADARVR